MGASKSKSCVIRISNLVKKSGRRNAQMADVVLVWYMYNEYFNCSSKI